MQQRRRTRLSLRKLRHNLENAFWLIHFCIVELTIIVLAVTCAWKLIVRH